MFYTICALIAAGVLLGIDIRQRREIQWLRATKKAIIQDGLNAFEEGKKAGRAQTVQQAFEEGRAVGWFAAARGERMARNGAHGDKIITAP